MRLLFVGSLVFFCSCSVMQQEPRDKAEACISDQLKSGSKVSAAQASVLVANCRAEAQEWLESTMHRACRGACDYNDPRLIEERERRAEIIDEVLMMRASDQVRPSFYVM
ncbi:MAG TPA: hypothetical protein VFZ35_00310 [Sphingomicrobium sp.]